MIDSSRRSRFPNFPIQEVTYAYLLLIVIAEYLLYNVNPFVSIVMHSGILLSLIMWVSATQSISESKTLSAITLIPILRLLTTITPLSIFAPGIQELVIALIMLLLARTYIYFHNITLSDIKFSYGFSIRQIAIAISGISTGVLLGILYPASLFVGNIMIMVVVTLITVLVEELLFRGILLEATSESLGVFAGIMYTSLMYAVFFVSQSATLVLFQFVLSVIYSILITKTRNATGVVIAHSITRVISLLLMPAVLVAYF